MRVVLVVALAALLAGPAVGQGDDLAVTLSKPTVKTALVDYGAAVSVYAHFIGACETNYDRKSVDAALSEVLQRRASGAAWDRVNDMLSSIWAQSYSEGRQKASDHNFSLQKCEELIADARRDITRDKQTLDRALAR